MPDNYRQIQKAQTRKHIIEVAMNQFARNGLTTTRTSDIAKAAKVSHGTVFAHFPTREALLDTVIEEFGLCITNRLHELVDYNCGIKEVLEAHLKGIEEYEEFYTRLVTEVRLLNESSRNSLVMIQSAISFHIIQAAERETKLSRINPAPLDMIFNTWIGLVHHYLANGDLFAPGESVIKRYKEKLVEYYINLITK